MDNRLKMVYCSIQEPSSPFWPGGNNKDKIRIIPIAVDCETMALNWNTFLEMYYGDYSERFQDTDIELEANATYDNLTSIDLFTLQEHLHQEKR